MYRIFFSKGEQLSTTVSCARTKWKRKKKKKGKEDGDASSMRGTISPVASNRNNNKKGGDDREEHAVHVMRITPSPGLTELPLLENDAACCGNQDRNGGDK